MCYKVNCEKCGKFSWGGCGRHLVSLHANIEEGMHCLCRPWPGVVIATSADKNGTSTLPAGGSTNTSEAGDYWGWWGRWFHRK